MQTSPSWAFPFKCIFHAKYTQDPQGTFLSLHGGEDCDGDVGCSPWALATCWASSCVSSKCPLLGPHGRQCIFISQMTTSGLRTYEVCLRCIRNAEMETQACPKVFGSFTSCHNLPSMAAHSFRKSSLLFA